MIARELCAIIHYHRCDHLHLNGNDWHIMQDGFQEGTLRQQAVVWNFLFLK